MGFFSDVISGLVLSPYFQYLYSTRIFLQFQQMNITSIIKDSRKISIIATYIIFLALIRCISEPFRLQHYSSRILTFADIKPFLIGSLVTSVALVMMTTLSLWGKYKMINAICILTIIILLFVKSIYMTP